MNKFITLILGLILIVAVFMIVSYYIASNSALVISMETNEKTKAELKGVKQETDSYSGENSPHYDWKNIITEPVLILLGKCEAPDGKGGINLNAYNPKDIDNKEKFGPFQFDKDTFYGAAEKFNLENPNISSSTQQVILTKKLISKHEWWRWGCWFKLFPR